MFTWLAVKAFFKKAWCFIKKYWKYLLAIFCGMGVLLYFRGAPQKAKDILDNAKDSFDKQIDVINKAHTEEINKRNEITKKYNETIEMIEENYSENKKELSNQKKKRVKEILNKHHNNPGSLAFLLSKEFGIKYIPNKEGEE